MTSQKNICVGSKVGLVAVAVAVEGEGGRGEGARAGCTTFLQESSIYYAEFCTRWI